MPSPNQRFSKLQFTITILLYGSMFIQSMDSATAEQKISVKPVQKATKLFVEPFTTAADANLPDNHLDVAALLTAAIRKQLNDEHRLQADPRLPALKLVGVVLSYKDSQLNVRAELYDGKRYLAYSRVERKIDLSDDWLDEIDLIAEQLLDELIDALRKPQQQGNSQHFNISPNHCVNQHSYAADPACNNTYYSGWGWWRQYDGYRAHNHKDRKNHEQNWVHDEHHTHDQREDHHEKHHWVSDARIEHHHKSRRIEEVVPAPLNTDLTVGKPSAAAPEVRPPDEAHHHAHEARQDLESPASMLKPDSVERIDSTALPNARPRHTHQSVPLSSSLSEKPRDSSNTPLPDESGANISDTIPKAESIIVNKDRVTPESTPISQDTDSAAEQDIPEQKTHARHRHEVKWGDTRYEQSVSTGNAPTSEVSQPLPQESTHEIVIPVLQPTSTSSSSSGTENLTPSLDTSVSNSSPASSSSSVSTDSATTTDSSSNASSASTSSYGSESSASPSSSPSSYASDSGTSSGSSSSSSSASTPSYSSESSSSPSSSSSSYSSDSGSSSGSSSSSTSSYSSTPSYSSPASSSSSDTSSSNTSSPTPAPAPSAVEPPPKPEPVKQAEPASSSTTP